MEDWATSREREFACHRIIWCWICQARSIYVPVARSVLSRTLSVAMKRELISTLPAASWGLLFMHTALYKVIRSIVRRVLRTRKLGRTKESFRPVIGVKRAKTETHQVDCLRNRYLLGFFDYIFESNVRWNWSCASEVKKFYIVYWSIICQVRDKYHYSSKRNVRGWSRYYQNYRLSNESLSN